MDSVQQAQHRGAPVPGGAKAHRIGRAKKGKDAKSHPDTLSDPLPLPSHTHRLPPRLLGEAKALTDASTETQVPGKEKPASLGRHRTWAL